VSAVALERNAVTLNVSAPTGGTVATVWVDPPGFVELRGTVLVKPAPAGNNVRFSLSPSAQRLRGDVGGSLGEGQPRLRFSKRVDDPRLYAGYVLAEILRRMRLEVTGSVALGGEAVHQRLTYVESEPVGVLVRELGKNSDNFYAEMLLKALGAFTKAPPARSRDGAEAVLAWMSEGGVVDAGTKVVNGSGLFDANRISAATMTAVLRRAHQSPRIGPEFVGQLAVGGVDGTLRSRFKGHTVDRAVRAKSGTLDRVTALSGYVVGPPGRSAVAFSFMIEGIASAADVRTHIDAVVETIASELWSR
jgi:D-alanyl-D-alanine carboxypeptidase/D-alanyl-D-alanine-endopeptidase (penicillin-binding protein 4)